MIDLPENDHDYEDDDYNNELDDDDVESDEDDEFRSEIDDIDNDDNNVNKTTNSNIKYDTVVSHSKEKTAVPLSHRSYEVLKAFYCMTRPVIEEIIVQQMSGYELDFTLRRMEQVQTAANLKDREVRLARALSRLSDSEDAVREREESLWEREKIVASREQQIAAEWERMQAIKLSLAELLGNKGGA